MPKPYNRNYDTVLPSPDERDAFKKYTDNIDKLRKRPGSARDAADYDIRGAFRAGLKPDKRGHLDDTYKKPNHPTFSTESVYHGVDGHEGGQWVDRGGGKWNFKASKTNLKFHSPDDLKKYFAQNEPDSRLILPRTKK